MIPTIIALLIVGSILLWRIEKMANELETLRTEVEEMSEAVDAGVTLIEGLSAQIRENATDPAALTALADRLDASARKLSAAVVANTPATDDSSAEEIDPADLEPIAEEPAPEGGQGGGTEGQQGGQGGEG